MRGLRFGERQEPSDESGKRVKTRVSDPLRESGPVGTSFLEEGVRQQRKRQQRSLTDGMRAKERLTAKTSAKESRDFVVLRFRTVGHRPWCLRSIFTFQRPSYAAPWCLDHAHSMPDDAAQALQLRRLNQRLSSVTAFQAPADVQSTAADRFFGPLPPPATLKARDDEVFRSNSLRSAFERIYSSFAACYGPIFRSLGAVTSWKDPLRSSCWSAVRLRSRAGRYR